jgi:hypothetical protein
MYLTPNSITRLSSSEIKEILPKKGTLFIKMKDGSKKAIDLSQIAEIEYIEP